MIIERVSHSAAEDAHSTLVVSGVLMLWATLAGRVLDVGGGAAARWGFARSSKELKAL
jgi:hypothetical protein